MIARIPSAGLASFDAYESLVLPLLAEHGGMLQRRLRESGEAAGLRAEAHLVWFPTETALAGYRADERRARHAPLMARSGATIELLRVDDIT